MEVTKWLNPRHVLHAIEQNLIWTRPLSSVSYDPGFGEQVAPIGCPCRKLEFAGN
jgi:hypothetical protein